MPASVGSAESKPQHKQFGKRFLNGVHGEQRNAPDAYLPRALRGRVRYDPQDKKMALSKEVTGQDCASLPEFLLNKNYTAQAVGPYCLDPQRHCQPGCVLAPLPFQNASNCSIGVYISASGIGSCNDVGDQHHGLYSDA